jgi:ABC-2 type transport system ATP-binding protein
MTPGAAEGWGAWSLRLRYPGGVLALDDVSLAVPAGQVTAVVGGDGAGKTSLLRCLAGAIRPDSGAVRGPGPERTGYLPASSGLYPDLTVTENLKFHASAYGLRAAAAQPRIAELTERAGLAAARGRLAGQLSGGMRQKLGVIAALLHEPDLLILDEPSTGVDPVSRSGLWSLIASAAASGAAVVLATTYLDDAQRAAQVLVLDAGRELAAGTPEHIVAEMPGSVVAAPTPPAGVGAARAWRRGASWRVWSPADGSAASGDPVTADLQDAVTVAALARDLAGPQTEGRDEQWMPVSWGSRPTRPTSTERRAAGAGPLASTDGVTCRFGAVTAVRDVSIEVRPGEIVGLIGANGAGKTTLIRMLLGLIPANSGEITLLGAAPSRRSRRRIGYVPQGLGLYSDLTAAQNMQFAAAVFGGRVPPDPAAPRGLPVGQLPLGVQRRVAFAQALAHDPELLILDEPTSGVDPLGRARLWQTIAAAVRAGAGALVSTHYMEEAGECDRLIIMAGGAVVAAGTAAEIIGTAQTTVVEATDWAAAFSRLERAGLPVALSGRTLRLPGVSPAAAEQALRGAETAASNAGTREATRRAAAGPGAADSITGVGGYRVYAAAATLEERFFELASAPGGAAAPREPRVSV